MEEALPQQEVEAEDAAVQQTLMVVNQDLQALRTQLEVYHLGVPHTMGPICKAELGQPLPAAVVAAIMEAEAEEGLLE